MRKEVLLSFEGMKLKSKSRFFDPRSVKMPMRGGNIWAQLLPWAYLAVVVLLLTLAVAIFWPVLKKNQDLRCSRVSLEKQIERAKALTLQLQHENHSLRTDRSYIEKKARDTLNLARPGETIFQFPGYQEVSSNASSMH